MRCPRCGEREATSERLVLGLDFGSFCRECGIETWSHLLMAAGVQPQSLIDLTEDIVEDVLESAGQRVIAVARRDPPTTDWDEIIVRLLDQRASGSAP